MPKKKTTEAQVLKAVNDYLYQMMKAGNGTWWRVNNGGVYDPVRKIYRKPKAKLAYKGISDVMGVYNGVFYAIEVKSSIGKPTSEQLAFGQMVEANGGVFMVVNDVNQLLDIFTK